MNNNEHNYTTFVMIISHQRLRLLTLETPTKGVGTPPPDNPPVQSKSRPSYDPRKAVVATGPSLGKRTTRGPHQFRSLVEVRKDRSDRHLGLRPWDGVGRRCLRFRKVRTGATSQDESGYTSLLRLRISPDFRGFTPRSSSV